MGFARRIPTTNKDTFLRSSGRSALLLIFRASINNDISSVSRFYIDSKIQKITLADVVTAIDGNDLFTGCGLGLRACNEKKPCPIHDEFKAIREKLKTMLESADLEEFTHTLEKEITFLKGN